MDSSSVIGEICALDKPMISWVLPPTERDVPEITKILEQCSIRVSCFEELEAALERAISNPDEHAQARQNANQIFFDQLDGRAGERSASHIIKLLPELKL
ncbi:MAG: hypothetical protein LRZ88_03495 [Candidatus Cloacimonetes bacterium]|nr:hypothetical protein [Candidatus Cloacimonadota bacterium]